MSFITILGGLFFGGMQKNDEPVVVEAAATNTKRVWMHTDYVDWWATDPNVSATIHYFGGSSQTTWPGVEMKYDSKNELHYYDVPIDTTKVVFARARRSDNHVWNQTVDIQLETYTNEYRYEIWNETVWEDNNKYEAVAFTPKTTTVVTNLADSIDTREKACSEASANNAVNTYNAMSTFEQSQFNSLELEGGVTGLQRLNYLRNFYNIETPLRAPDLSNSRRDDNAQAVFALTIGGAGLLLLGGYSYMNLKKKD